jgi:hypothetical protein
VAPEVQPLPKKGEELSSNSSTVKKKKKTKKNKIPLKTFGYIPKIAECVNSFFKKK